MKRSSLRLALALLLAPSFARAEESIIKQPDQHPSYIAELDVHGLFAYWGGPFLLGRYGTVGFGPGFRASFNILKNGFLPNVNDSVAIGVGAELVFDIDNTVRLVTPIVLQSAPVADRRDSSTRRAHHRRWSATSPRRG